MKKITKIIIMTILIITIVNIYSGTMLIVYGESKDTTIKGASPSHNLDEIVGEAQKFIEVGKNENSPMSGSNLKIASTTIYNILLTIGVFTAVAVGMYLGVKFMISTAEDKAKVKEALIPYIAGCIVVFGAFAIWRLTINLTSGIDKVSYVRYDTQYIATNTELKEYRKG